MNGDIEQKLRKVEHSIKDREVKTIIGEDFTQKRVRRGEGQWRKMRLGLRGTGRDKKIGG